MTKQKPNWTAITQMPNKHANHYLWWTKSIKKQENETISEQRVGKQVIVHCESLYSIPNVATSVPWIMNRWIDQSMMNDGWARARECCCAVLCCVRWRTERERWCVLVSRRLRECIDTRRWEWTGRRHHDKTDSRIQRSPHSIVIEYILVNYYCVVSIEFVST